MGAEPAYTPSLAPSAAPIFTAFVERAAARRLMALAEAKGMATGVDTRAIG